MVVEQFHRHGRNLDAMLAEEPPEALDNGVSLEVQRLIDGIHTLYPAPQQLLQLLTRHFQIPITPKPGNIKRHKTRPGAETTVAWENNLKGIVSVARKALPPNLSLYSNLSPPIHVGLAASGRKLDFNSRPATNN